MEIVSRELKNDGYTAKRSCALVAAIKIGLHLGFTKHEIVQSIYECEKENVKYSTKNEINVLKQFLENRGKVDLDKLLFDKRLRLIKEPGSLLWYWDRNSGHI